MLKFPAIIPTQDLKLADVPDLSSPWSGPDKSTPWRTISGFALTFDSAERDPYHLEENGLAGLSSDSNLVLLRAHLFFEQRRWNHFGRPPDEKAMGEIRRVLALIRGKLSQSADSA